jgi:hypothetical protein
MASRIGVSRPQRPLQSSIPIVPDDQTPLIEQRLKGLDQVLRQLVRAFDCWLSRPEPNEHP